MILRIWGRLKFAVETFVLGGPLHRLFVTAVLIGFIAIVGGALVLLFGGPAPPADRDNFLEALWWAFLRLSDPGYLGDDVGTLVRVVSTLLTVLGYVVFLGSLVAIMTQWLNSSIARLQSGLTPLALNNHLLLLGWSSRTVAIVREILLSEGRVERFLLRRRAGRLRVVILAEEVVPGMIQELRDRLGDMWDPAQIILRTGSPLRLEHLRRADFLHAAAILLPSPDSGADLVEYPDARTIKTIMATGKSSREDGATEMPLLVAELADARKLEIARRAYGGPIEVIASDLIVARLLAQNIRHPGISKVYAELLRHDVGSELYLREFPPLVGRDITDVTGVFSRAIVLGLLHGEGAGCRALLNQPRGATIQPGDRLVLLASEFDAAAPDGTPHVGAQTQPATAVARPLRMPPHRRVLVLGWNHVVPALIRELEGYQSETFEVDIVSLVPIVDRSEELARFDAAPGRAQVRMLHGEYTSLSDLSALEAGSYDTVMVLSSDRLESEGERDARSILGSLVLAQAVSQSAKKPHTIVELLDSENVSLVNDAGDESLLTPAIMSHVLTQVALHRDLRVVYDELFGPDGSEIFFRPANEYGLCTRDVNFVEIQAAANAHSEIALGVRLGKGGRATVLLNPDRDTTWKLSEGDDIVVLTSV
jgi:hypothetical protein